MGTNFHGGGNRQTDCKLAARAGKKFVASDLSDSFELQHHADGILVKFQKINARQFKRTLAESPETVSFQSYKVTKFDSVISILQRL